MKHLHPIAAFVALSVAGCSGQAAAPVNESAAHAGKPALALPLYEEAVLMERPVLPARLLHGECPVVDQCEFGTEWRTCEPIPLYREAAEGAPVRRLKAMETFIAEGGVIELIAPGEVELLADSYPYQTGGYYLPAGTRLEVYGPLHDSKALYFDPKTKRAFSPPANEDHWWWDEKVGRMTVVPKMNWWVRIRLKDGTRGWLKLASVEDREGFPNYHNAEQLEAWDIHKTRDDETPDCPEMLADDPG